MIIVKALYGLKSSGLQWWERFSEILSSMNFVESKAERDIWMRKCKDHYEYLARYVDDLMIDSKNPQQIVEVLGRVHGLKLKGTGPITYYLGCDFYRDENNVLCMAPRKYIGKILDNYYRMFNTRPKLNVWSPLERGDHPDLDSSEELDIDWTKRYQSLIGALQWAISIGRFDIHTAVMTMSKFRIAPREGHLNRVKRIFGYLSRFKEGAIRFRTGTPDYSAVNIGCYDWMKSVYGEVHEEIPNDVPVPMGKEVTLTSYVDANLMHDVITGRSVTGVLHLINQTPIEWYSKSQATVETATYGTEFIAARVAIEQIMEMRVYLRYLGVPISGPTYLYGDNKSVVDSGSIPYFKLHKRHLILCYHRVREAVASGLLYFIHIAGSDNPADVLSKAWGNQQVWNVLQPLLFWKGDTMECVNDLDG